MIFDIRGLSHLITSMPFADHIAIGVLLNYVLRRSTLHKGLIACDDGVFTL